ncbi:hypothetical protein EVAR_19230_1 [Eumeta japonica]|uniref:Uncharacterized protein n=1 Tax=Eumeta variegata TaxID=151549 RepID=A0A4C1VE10_EUMVA|nr:hypothetical protein EVAR_19230_1 [Eumeta japonica]
MSCTRCASRCRSGSQRDLYYCQTLSEPAGQISATLAGKLSTNTYEPRVDGYSVDDMRWRHLFLNAAPFLLKMKLVLDANENNDAAAKFTTVV